MIGRTSQSEDPPMQFLNRTGQPRDTPGGGLHHMAPPTGIPCMAEFFGLLSFLALAIVMGMAIVPHMLPAFGWLLGAGIVCVMVAGLLYVGGVALELPMTWLDRTRLGKALASDRARDIRRSLALAYWGILIALTFVMVALGHFVGPH